MESGGIVAKRLGGKPILAVATTKIAYQHAKTHCLRSRQSMKKWFLFDGIVMDTCGVVERNSQHTIGTAIANLTGSSLAGAQLAAVTTGCANQRAFFKGNEQLTRMGVFIQ